MNKVVKTYFIPHAENNYHPHVLHGKRAVFYSAVFVVLKLIVILFVFSLPDRVFVLPDVLAQEQKKILALTNELRAEHNLPPLTEAPRLDVSSQNKADDMAVQRYFSHVSPDKKTVSDWVRGSGYTYRVAGENLAMGFSSAEDVVLAWQKSPTHYANLIDTDYSDIGVGMQEGVYADVRTVYVAQHFAAPSRTAIPSPKKAPVKSVVPVEQLNNNPPLAPTPAVVLSEKIEPHVIVPPPPALAFVSEKSRLYWQEQDGGTLLTAKATIQGLVEHASVTVGTHSFTLSKIGENSYSGTLLIRESADDFFRVIIPPSIMVKGLDGSVIESQINWYNVKVVSPSPIDLYLKSKTALQPLTHLFTVTKGVYLFFILFFSAALIVNICTEIRKQRPHVIVQTTALLTLLTLLYFV